MRKNTGSQFKYTSKGNNSTDVTELSGDVEGRGLLAWKDVEVRKRIILTPKYTYKNLTACKVVMSIR